MVDGETKPQSAVQRENRERPRRLYERPKLSHLGSVNRLTLAVSTGTKSDLVRVKPRTQTG